jgi:hypothetical protein
LIQCLRAQLPPGGVEVTSSRQPSDGQHGAYFPFCALWEFGAGSVLPNLLSILAAGYAARGVARAVASLVRTQRRDRHNTPPHAGQN